MLFKSLLLFSLPIITFAQDFAATCESLKWEDDSYLQAKCADGKGNWKTTKLDMNYCFQMGSEDLDPYDEYIKRGAT